MHGFFFSSSSFKIDWSFYRNHLGQIPLVLALLCSNCPLIFKRTCSNILLCFLYIVRHLTPPISQIQIGQHLIFCSLTSPTCCNPTQNCTPVKHKKQKAGFPNCHIDNLTRLIYRCFNFFQQVFLTVPLRLFAVVNLFLAFLKSEYILLKLIINRS